MIKGGGYTFLKCVPSAFLCLKKETAGSDFDSILLIQKLFRFCGKSCCGISGRSVV